MKRKFPGKTVESLTKRQLREVVSEAIRTLNRTKGKKGDVFQFPSGGIDRIPVNRQFTPPREGHVFEILDDDAFKELKGNFFRRLMANTDEDVQAFAKRVVANKQDVKLEKLTQGQRKEFMNMVDDRITLGNKKFMEKYTDEFPLPKEFNIYEDFASGGVAGQLHLNRQGYLFGGPAAGSKALKAIMDAVRANKKWGVGGPPYKPGKTSFDVKDLTKRLYGKGFSLADIKKMSEAPIASGINKFNFPEFSKGWKDLKAKVIKEKLNESKLQAESMIEAATKVPADNPTAKKVQAQFLRSGKKQLEEANAGLKEIEIYIDMVAKKGRKLHAAGGIARAPMFGGGAAWKIWKDFVSKLWIKSSNQIRRGEGKWKGLTQEQWIKQHDNMVKKMKEWEMSGKKGLPRGAEEYIGMNDLQIAKAIKEATEGAKTQKILEQFNVTGKKGHAAGGIAGQLHLNEGGRARFANGSRYKIGMWNPDKTLVSVGINQGTGTPEWMYPHDAAAMGIFPTMDYEGNKIAPASTNVPGTPIVPTGSGFTAYEGILPGYKYNKATDAYMNPQGDEISRNMYYNDISRLPTTQASTPVTQSQTGDASIAEQIAAQDRADEGGRKMISDSMVKKAFPTGEYDGTDIKRVFGDNVTFVGDPENEQQVEDYFRNRLNKTQASTPVAETPDDLLTGDILGTGMTEVAGDKSYGWSDYLSDTFLTPESTGDKTISGVTQAMANMPKYMPVSSTSAGRKVLEMVKAGQKVPVAHGFQTSAGAANVAAKGFQNIRPASSQTLGKISKAVPTMTDIERAIRTGSTKALGTTTGAYAAIGPGSEGAATRYAQSGLGRGVTKGTGPVVKGAIDASKGVIDRGVGGNLQIRAPAGVMNQALKVGPKAAQVAGGILKPSLINKTLARILPGAQTALGAARAVQHAKEGNYGQMALAGISAVPGPIGWAGLAGETLLGQKDKIAPYAKRFGSALGDKMANLFQKRGIDPRMAATYAQNRQIMADPRMAGSMGAAKGGLANILGV